MKSDDQISKDTEQKVSHQPHLVIARRYRPRDFSGLIGQEAMVRTLTNAFSTGRIAHAYMLTGVRGVGKTTTARILARALNYEVPGETDLPSIEMPKMGTHCQAIIESRHMDVIEMDAASHTGVDDIREITNSANYRPVSARYKVFIIDEVHMLSNQAFNGLLKTLEEPPPHVKFIFATTEIRKVPVTVLSRCQRFDLKRVERHVLVDHLASIVSQEGLTAEPEALRMIARAAEGSVRDALSLLDQAISYGAGHLKSDDVRGMLGLGDHSRILGLFEHVLKGHASDVIHIFQEIYALGADPVAVLIDLADVCHSLTRLIILGDNASSLNFEHDPSTLKPLAEKVDVALLGRLWQALNKAVQETRQAAQPDISAEMALVRLCYVSSLPSPEDLMQQLRRRVPLDMKKDQVSSSKDEPVEQGSASCRGQGEKSSTPDQAELEEPTFTVEQLLNEDAMTQEEPQAETPQEEPSSSHSYRSSEKSNVQQFHHILEIARAKREVKFRLDVENYVHLVNFKPGHLEIRLEKDAPGSLVSEISAKLKEWTGNPWMVIMSNAVGQPTIKQARQAQKEKLMTEAKAMPLVNKVISVFPGARIATVKPLKDEDETTEYPDFKKEQS